MAAIIVPALFSCAVANFVRTTARASSVLLANMVWGFVRYTMNFGKDSKLLLSEKEFIVYRDSTRIIRMIATIHDEETNMASVLDRLPDGKIRVRLFDVEAELFVDVVGAVIYPASMEARAWEKAFSVSLA